MVRYLPQNKEKASFLEGGVILSKGEASGVIVRGVGGKDVGMP